MAKNAKFDVFLSVSEFKKSQDIDTLEIKRRTKEDGTETVFATSGSKTFKVEQNIDLKKTLRFAYVIAEGIEQGCLINVDESNIVTEAVL